MKKTFYTLHNGIKVIIVPLDTKLTNLSLSIFLGSNHEKDNMMNITHLFEHLFARFTSKKYPDYEFISRELSKRGAYSNAYVDKYETKFFIRGFFKDIDFFIDILSNTLNYYHMDDDAYKEKEAVIQELKNIMSNNEYNFEYAIYKYLYPEYYYQYDYKKHIAFIKKYDINRIYDFIKEHISLKKCTVTISCPCNSVKKTKMLVNKYFGILKKKSISKITYPIYQHHNRLLRILYVKNKHIDSNVLMRIYICKNIKYLSKQYICLMYIRELLLNFETGIFYRILRKKLGYIYNISMEMDIDKYDSRSSSYYISTSTDNKYIPALIYNIFSILQTYTITHDDILQARNSFIFNFEMKKFYNITSYNNFYEEQMLYSNTILEYKNILDKFKSISNEDIIYYYKIMRRDLIKNGMVFYYSNTNNSTEIDKVMKDHFKYKLHKL